MKIKIFKGNGIEAKRICDNNVEKDFSNLEMIDNLYQGEHIELDFEDNITSEEKEKINQLFEDIAKISKNETKDNIVKSDTSISD